MREKQREKIEVHVAAICYRKRGSRLEFLAGKRSENRNLFPCKWECGGGTVRSGETFPKACNRQIKEEFGIEIEIKAVLNTYQIISEKQSIPGVVFLCRPKPKSKTKHDGIELVESGWYTLDEAKTMDFIPGVLKNLREAVSLISYEKLRRNWKKPAISGGL
jgi:8-oxo-dGTP pyrophosphatase MutT (NUDIX family)